MPFNFFVIIFVQILTFLVLFSKYNHGHKFGIKELLVSILWGIMIGISFDILLATLGVYSYRSTSPSYKAFPWGLSFVQLIVNGIFSFGPAVAAAYYITPKAHPLKNVFHKKVIATCMLGVLVISVTLLFVVRSPLILLFAVGLSIISIGELVLVFRSKIGPMLSLILVRDYATLFRIWGMVIVIGLLCEVTNYFFPFWVWLPKAHYPHLWIETLIIIFGYVALFHPMIVMWQLRRIVKKGK